MKKILIIGANGQLAHDLINVLNKSSEVIKATRDDFDVTNYQECEKFIDFHKPQVVINTAAYHNTKLCEENPEISFLVNAIGAYNVAKTSAKVNAKIIFFSTDYVFDGSKKTFNEQDSTNPLNVYGASKLAGENLTKVANTNYLIIRTTALYGEKVSGKGHNFVLLMLEKAKTERAIEVVNDKYCSPTYSLDLSLKIKELIDKNIPSGTYHIVNQGSISWYQFARKIFQIKNIEVKVIPISTDSKKDFIKRPKYSVLVTKKLESLRIPQLRSWDQALSDFLSTKSLPLK